MSECIKPTNNINNITIDDERIFEKRNNIKSFEEGMKLYEAHSLTYKIPDDRPFIIRLNANSYAKITKILNRPNVTNQPNDFNKIYNIAMIKTASAFMLDNIFKPVSIYTQYDEIIMIFDSAKIFKGDTQKYISMICSKASVYFIREFYNLFDSISQYYSSEFIQKEMPVFSGQLVFFPKGNEYEIMNYIIWRNSKIRSYVQDCVELFATADELSNKKKEDQVEIYKKVTGIEIEDDIPFYMTHGVYIKKSIYNTCYISNNITDINKSVDVIYPNVHIWSMKVKYSDAILEQLLAKYYVSEEWQNIAKESTTKIWYIYDQEELQRETIYFKDTPEISIPIEENDTDNSNVSDVQKLTIEDLETIRRDLNNIPIIYHTIPFWSLHLLVMHLFSIFGNQNISNIIQMMIYYGLSYSIGMRFISSHIKETKFVIHHYIMLFWIAMFGMITFTSIMTIFKSSQLVQLLSIVSVYYGYYFTILNGILLYIYIKTKINLFTSIIKIKND
jgi:tRNA(His) 5'-end guanylyltransferase